MVWQRPGLIGNPGWVRSSACTWLSSSSESITAWADGSTWRPTMSARLAARPGSRERLKVRTRCGRSWCVHQMRSTASTMSAIWDNSENICSLRVFLPVTRSRPRDEQGPGIVSRARYRSRLVSREILSETSSTVDYAHVERAVAKGGVGHEDDQCSPVWCPAGSIQQRDP